MTHKWTVHWNNESYEALNSIAYNHSLKVEGKMSLQSSVDFMCISALRSKSLCPIIVVCQLSTNSTVLLIWRERLLSSAWVYIKLTEHCIYFQSWNWKSRLSNPKLTPYRFELGYRGDDRVIRCVGAEYGDQCEENLCQCDKRLALALARRVENIKQDYVEYDRSKCNINQRKEAFTQCCGTVKTFPFKYIFFSQIFINTFIRTSRPFSQ